MFFFSSQFKQENKINTSIPIVTPLYYPDISGIHMIVI